MSPYIMVLMFCCGAVLLWKSGEELHEMDVRTNNVMRMAQWLIAIGAMAMVIAPVAPTEPYLLHRGLELVVLGKTLKVLFDRRRYHGASGQRN